MIKTEWIIVFYDAELSFFCRIMKNAGIDTCIFDETVPTPKMIDRGLREYLDMDEDYRRLVPETIEKAEENTIYKVTDSVNCKYIFMILPQSRVRTVLAAGPYLSGEITRESLMETAEKYSVPPKLFSQLEKYFGSLPVIENERYINNLCNSLGEVLWGSLDNFSFRTLRIGLTDIKAEDIILNFENKNDDPLLAIRILEERYDGESKLMQAISSGKTNKAEQLIANISTLQFEKRSDDPLRNAKNYLIVANTLLRKAAEYGSVHPFYIDGISTDFAKKIEKTSSVKDTGELLREMIRKYCALVKKHSMKLYSLPVQKVITVIDSDLTADLGLKRLAEMFNINASYLSALFKKETGKTLTEYVIGKRIEYAAYLLKSSDLQIQTVAQHCGIYDVNYFTKVFKKYTGKTPKEFRNS